MSFLRITPSTHGSVSSGLLRLSIFLLLSFPDSNGKAIWTAHLNITFQGTENIVAVMIGNLKGMEILHSIQKGVYVTVIIEVGRMHMHWEAKSNKDRCEESYW
ncbi:RNF148 isoform 2, partial [Pan troglodytes]|uniref:RNF148 n=3 Tax=Pan TaxID=9596 RepID=A0A2I3RU38_PANTR